MIVKASAMENFISDELLKISYDSVEEDTDQAWFSLIQNLSFDQLQTLRDIFKTNIDGLQKEEFLDTICCIYGSSNYSMQSLLLFDEINKTKQTTITWTDFLNFLEENLESKANRNVVLKMKEILKVPHTNRETIVKIVVIETDQFFCYAIIAKHGKIGLYDGHLKFLTAYHVLMTREDVTRKGKDRKRKNRWVTDAVFCNDVVLFMVTNTARTIMIYDASGLKHVPLWLIISLPDIIQCLSYKCYNENDDKQSILFVGDNCGGVKSLTFLQPKNGLFRKKHNDKMSLFYWMELKDEKQYVIIKNHGRFHNESIRQMKYFADNATLITCSKDDTCSVLKKYIAKKRSYIFKMARGTSSFALSRALNILITGTNDGTIRVWNSVITSKPIAVFKEHAVDIVDLQIMESQQLFISCSRDGILKLWNIKEEKCIQTIAIKFPPFGIFGKLIEWGKDCLYPGGKQSNETPWERPQILVTCCNYIACIKVIFNGYDQDLTDLSILPPPPLQNSVLIPKYWKLHEKDNYNNSLSLTADESYEKLNTLDFICKRDFGKECGCATDINYKFPILEMKKLQMQGHVAQGSPYLALDLHEIEDLKLSPNLLGPTKGKIKNIVEKLEKLLEEASSKDQIFSEPSSSRSRSSRSSIVDIDI